MEHASLLGLAVLLAMAAAAPPKVGSKAPDFSLPDQTGKLHRLAALRGKKPVVLAFYVIDNTPG